MSYDLIFFHNEETISSDDALKLYEDAFNSFDGEDDIFIHPSVSSFLSDLNSLGETEEWACDFDMHQGIVAVYMGSSATEGWPELAELTDHHNLTLYDPQSDLVVLPATLGGNWRDVWDNSLEG